MPIEFGKDIITMGPDKVPCAFQLKANPGTRMTLNEFRKFQDQLLELVTHPIVYPGVPKRTQHRCYIVTNGLVEEEVARSVDDVNISLQNRGFGKDRIQLWPRGKLHEMAIRLGSSFWPSELEDINAILELLVHRGDDIFPAEKLHRLLAKLLNLNINDKKFQRPDLTRRITSAAVLNAVALRNFSKEENHVAIITAWVMFAVYSIAASDRHGCEYRNSIQSSVDLAKIAIIDSLASLCAELQVNSKISPNRGIEIGLIYRARATLLYALMSIYWLWSDEVGWAMPEHKEFLLEWIPRNFDKSLLWGEGVVPQFMSHYWYLTHTDHTANSEFILINLVRSVVNLCYVGQGPRAFPSPYFSFEDIARSEIAGVHGSYDPLRDETAKAMSYTAEYLLHTLVRANYKQACKSIWPIYSKLGLKEFCPGARWQYSLTHSAEGQSVMTQISPTKQWDELVSDAANCSAGRIPVFLRSEPFMLLLFVLFFPYRGTADVMRFLGAKFSEVWMIDRSRPT